MAHGQKLKFISNDDLYRFTTKMVKIVQGAKERVATDPYKSVIDPFSALVDAAVQGVSLEEWMEQEKSRQIQKSLQNSVGEFHQNVIGAMPGWENAGIGGNFDVINRKKGIIAEIKNKYNTLNSGGLINLYNTLASHLDYGDKKGYTAYYVAVITKTRTPFDKPFVPSKRGTPMAHREDVRAIDGRTFYDIASGEDGALRKLYDALPEVLEQILGKPIKGNGVRDAIGETIQDAPQADAYKATANFIALFRRAFG